MPLWEVLGNALSNGQPMSNPRCPVLDLVGGIQAKFSKYAHFLAVANNLWRAARPSRLANSP